MNPYMGAQKFFLWKKEYPKPNKITQQKINMQKISQYIEANIAQDHSIAVPEFLSEIEIGEILMYV